MAMPEYQLTSFVKPSASVHVTRKTSFFAGSRDGQLPAPVEIPLSPVLPTEPRGYSLSPRAPWNGKTVVCAARGHVADGTVAVLVVVQDTKGLAVNWGVVEATKSLGKFGAVLYGLELQL